MAKVIRIKGSSPCEPTSGYAFGLRLPIFGCLFGLAFALSSGLAFSQDNAVSQDKVGIGEQRSSLRPALPLYFSTSLDAPTALTKVPLSDDIARIAKGTEPNNKQQLVSLQKQQTEVAKRAPLVTVNLQHGNTQGSGVIVSGDGFILTAAHVAGRPNQRIHVVLHDGTRVEGKSLGLNRNEDAGLVKIVHPVRSPDNPWPHASLGNSTDLQPGSWVMAVGHPGGWQADRPAVVRIGRLLRNIDSTLITDCALIGGDSGGPLFDLEGKLIGIHSRIGVEVDENMHVPLDVFYKSHERLIRSEAWGSLPGFRPYIGVEGASVEDSGGRCVIERVTPKGPADRAGIEPGDIIVRFDGQKIGVFKELKDSVDAMVPGDSVEVELERNSRRMIVRIMIGSLNP